MNKNTNIDYYEDEVNITEKVIESALELSDMIEEKFQNKPAKSNKLFKAWKKDTNSLIEQYNSSFGKAYTKIR